MTTGLDCKHQVHWFYVLVVALIACDAKPAADCPPESGEPPKLASEEAQKIVDDYYKDRPPTCTWTSPHRQTNEGFTYRSHDDTEQRCMTALSRRNLAAEGECLSKGCPGGCCAREVLARGIASLSLESPMGLAFPCGTSKELRIVAVSTEGSSATIEYTRTHTPDEELLEDLRTCELTRSAPGERALVLRAKRYDDGTWRRDGVPAFADR